MPCKVVHREGALLTIDWGLSREYNHDELKVGSLCPELTEERFYVVNPLDVALKEGIFDHRHASITTDTTQLVDEVPKLTAKIKYR